MAGRAWAEKMRHNLYQFSAPRTLTVEKWKEQVQQEIVDSRRMLEHWLHELDLYTNGSCVLGTQEDQDKAICERTRMVRVAGQTLHSNTEIYKAATKQARVEGEWDRELAEVADNLLQKAAEVVVTNTTELPCKDNCRNRADYLRRCWTEWCNAYAQELQSQGIQLPSQEPVDK